MKSGRVVPLSGSGSSSGCRPHNFFYNFHHQSHQQQHNPNYYPPHQNHHHQHQQQQQQQQQQQPPPPPHPPHQHQNYAMLPCFNQHNANGWAGIPLISTAASSNRRQRKPTAGGTGPGHRLPPPHPPQTQPMPMYNSNRDLHSSNEYDLNPMTRLAIHTQGAPLLLSGSYNRNRLNCQRQLRPLNPNSLEGYSSCGYKVSNGPMHPKTKENNLSVGPGTCSGGGSNTQSDSTAVACLPRIIKPRKRRKKDRKPLTSVSSNFGVIKKTDNDSAKREHSLFHDQQVNPFPSMAPFIDDVNSIRNEPCHVADGQDPATGSICFCRQCDPLSRIWAFPLRRSYSDNSSDTTEFERATKDVGVIGSNRSSQVMNINAQKQNQTTTNLTGSLSDSSDSGYGDILSGIQIGDNFFTNNNNNDHDTFLQLETLPNDLLLSPTAESLLTESINEISRKLMETCDIKGASGSANSSCSSSSSSSSSSTSDSCSVFSDSGLSSATSNNLPSGDELIFNFENLSINSFNQQHHPNLLFPPTTTTNESMFDCFANATTLADINNNTIHVPSGVGSGDVGGINVGGAIGSPRIDPQLFNCLDMLWGTHHQASLSLHPDTPKQITSQSSASSSSSSSSFYRSAVASM